MKTYEAAVWIPPDFAFCGNFEFPNLHKKFIATEKKSQMKAWNSKHEWSACDVIAATILAQLNRAFQIITSENVVHVNILW